MPVPGRGSIIWRKSASAGRVGAAHASSPRPVLGDAAACESMVPRWRCLSTNGTCSTRPSCSGKRGGLSTTTTTATRSSRRREHPCRCGPRGLRDVHLARSYFSKFCRPRDIPRFQCPIATSTADGWHSPATCSPREGNFTSFTPWNTLRLHGRRDVHAESIQAPKKKGVELALPSHGGRHGCWRRHRPFERRVMDCVRLGRGAAHRRAGSGPDHLPPGASASFRCHGTCSGAGSGPARTFTSSWRGGKALFVDYGHAFWAHLHTGPDHRRPGIDALHRTPSRRARRDHGVRFDLVVPTHVHDDHTCGIPFLQKHHGTQCWALEEVGQVLADPAAWTSTPCTFPKPIRIDR